MPANRIQLQSALQKPYDRFLFAKDILRPIFNSYFTLNSSLVKPSVEPNQSESTVIDKVGIYGKITLEDATEVTCYEIILKPNVRLEYSKVAIQHYVRKLLTVGQAALINFISPTDNSFWRLTLVAKDSELKKDKITEKTTNSKRYTYLLGPSETCKTPAERFELLSVETKLDLDILVMAFSVEKLSKAFFDEYTRHYESFIAYLTKPANKKSLFNGDEKAIRDYSKKLLGRIVFLYFVQKKRWLGASDTNYKDGMTDFIMKLFHLSGSNSSFYPNWLTKLFFDTLNNERKDDAFEMPDGKKVKIPFLNGGLFDKEEHDDKIIPFPANLFHNHDNEDDPKYRGFLDFLNAFNFTIYEDSPDEKTVAVDPEMLGHIFENLLEDNKDKGAFYTPKEIVHYMCQESLIEYLSTHLSKEYTVYRSLGKDQIEFFGNETRVGQFSLLEQMGDKALNHDDVGNIVKTKDISKLTNEQLKRIDQLLDSVKICDPAIGSGAFPMGLLQEIYSIKEVIAYVTSKEWKPAEVKENIIQNSIYGVDIEKGAVDIARLRFWLSLVVDEDKPKPLPNLDYKIVVGDSLVSKIKFDDSYEIVEIDWTADTTKDGMFGQSHNEKNIELLNLISQKQKEYFNPNNKNKKELSKVIRNLKIDILINQLELMVKTKGIENKPTGNSKKLKEQMDLYLKTLGWKNIISKLFSLKKQYEQSFNHFDWKLDFPEILNPYLIGDNAGFDIVIANPPYGAKINSDDLNVIERKFKKYPCRIKNSAIFFIYLNDLLKYKKMNVQSYIVPKSITYSISWNPPAKYITNGLLKLIDTGKAFENVKLEQVIFVRASSNRTDEYTNGLYIDKNIIEFNKIKKSFVDKNGVLICGIRKDEIDILESILHSCSIKWGDIFISDRGLNWQSKVAKRIGDFPIYRGAQLRKYKLLEATDFIDLTKFSKSEYEYQFRPKILNQLAIAHVMNPYPHFYLQATLDYENKLVYETIAISILKNSNDSLNYYLGLNNSKLFAWLVYKFIYSNAIRSTRFDDQYIGRIPIPNCEEIDKNKLASLVKYILYLRLIDNSNSDKFIPAYFEQIVDGMVYELYFPELLKKHNREIIKHLGELPAITDEMTDQKKMKIITEVFNRLNAKDHPVRINLEKMKEIEEIKIIEGIN